MKKILILTAAILIFQGATAFAEETVAIERVKIVLKHDTNGDGVISQDEFLEKAKKNFQAADADGKGTISKEEAKSMRESKRKKMKERRQKLQDRKANRSAE